MRNIILSTLVFSTINLSANALTPQKCTTNFCYKAKIGRIYTRDDGKTYLMMKSSVNKDALTCNLLEGKYAQLPTGAQYENIYTLTLAAFLHNKDLSIRLNPGTQNVCLVKYVYID